MNMDIEEIRRIIACGETSRVQFKETFSNSDAIAAELVAFANAKGGMILFGIEDKSGEVIGLDFPTLRTLGNRVSNIATELVKPLIPVSIEVFAIPFEDGDRRILAVQVEEGVAKPYKDRNGTIWLKQGCDKRKLTENAEQLRLFQQSGLLFIDEMTVPDTSFRDIEPKQVREYLSHVGGDYDTEITPELCRNINIMKGERLTLGGLLFFGIRPQKYRPVFCVKAVAFYGNDITGNEYRDSEDITGVIPMMFDRMMSFLGRNLHHLQRGQNFNSLGILEISSIALEELCQNALTHRDYSKSSPIRLLIFDNRVEIISPGALPNSLTVENIKMGNAVARNPLVASFCARTMKYRGLGSGVLRALKEQPNIQLENDVDGEQFKVVIPRPDCSEPSEPKTGIDCQAP